MAIYGWILYSYYPEPRYISNFFYPDGLSFNLISRSASNVSATNRNVDLRPLIVLNKPVIMFQHTNTEEMIKHISGKLSEREQLKEVPLESMDHLSELSAVLILLGYRPGDDRPCLILNKRSLKVVQAGDLCCPGGRFLSGVDSAISKILALPGFPMAKWPALATWRKEHPCELSIVSQLFATSLRESFEEMFLNPFGVRFSGALFPFALELTNRIVYPMTGWTRQKRFKPNWEVERIVYLPLESLMEESNYGVCRLLIAPDMARALSHMDDEHPCFVHKGQQGTELLWGITYRMVTSFLEIVSGFIPPDSGSLPVFYKHLDKNYLNGIP